MATTPERSVLYGGALIVAAMLGATAVTALPAGTAARVAVYVAALVVAGIGVTMTFRDIR